MFKLYFAASSILFAGSLGFPAETPDLSAALSEAGILGEVDLESGVKSAPVVLVRDVSGKDVTVKGGQLNNKNFLPLFPFTPFLLTGSNEGSFDLNAFFGITNEKKEDDNEKTRSDDEHHDCMICQAFHRIKDQIAQAKEQIEEAKEREGRGEDEHDVTKTEVTEKVLADGTVVKIKQTSVGDLESDDDGASFFFRSTSLNKIQTPFSKQENEQEGDKEDGSEDEEVDDAQNAQEDDADTFDDDEAEEEEDKEEEEEDDDNVNLTNIVAKVNEVIHDGAGALGIKTE